MFCIFWFSKRSFCMSYKLVSLWGTKDVPTRSKFTSVLVGTFGPHNVVNTKYTQKHTCAYRRKWWIHGSLIKMGTRFPCLLGRNRNLFLSHCFISEGYHMHVEIPGQKSTLHISSKSGFHLLSRPSIFNQGQWTPWWIVGTSIDLGGLFNFWHKLNQDCEGLEHSVCCAQYIVLLYNDMPIVQLTKYLSKRLSVDKNSKV